jgi:hypothetical protein
MEEHWRVLATQPLASSCHLESDAAVPGQTGYDLAPATTDAASARSAANRTGGGPSSGAFRHCAHAASASRPVTAREHVSLTKWLGIRLPFCQPVPRLHAASRCSWKQPPDALVGGSVIPLYRRQGRACRRSTTKDRLDSGTTPRAGLCGATQDVNVADQAIEMNRPDVGR